MPRTCGNVTCDSSTIMRKSSGKKSINVYGGSPGLRLLNQRVVILDAGTVADFEQHFQVEPGAGTNPLRFQQLALLLELRTRSVSSARMPSTAERMRSSGVTKCLAG